MTGNVREIIVDATGTGRRYLKGDYEHEATTTQSHVEAVAGYLKDLVLPQQMGVIFTGRLRRPREPRGITYDDGFYYADYRYHNRADAAKQSVLAASAVQSQRQHSPLHNGAGYFINKAVTRGLSTVIGWEAAAALNGFSYYEEDMAGEDICDPNRVTAVLATGKLNDADQHLADYGYEDGGPLDGMLPAMAQGLLSEISAKTDIKYPISLAGKYIVLKAMAANHSSATDLLLLSNAEILQLSS